MPPAEKTESPRGRKRLKKRSGEGRMPVAADVGDRLERTAGHQRARFSEDHFLKEAFAVLLREAGAISRVIPPE